MKLKTAARAIPIYQQTVWERSTTTCATKKTESVKCYSRKCTALVKKIGRTTYVVRIHFSETSMEALSDKIKRMFKNEIQQMG